VQALWGFQVAVLSGGFKFITQHFTERNFSFFVLHGNGLNIFI